MLMESKLPLTAIEERESRIEVDVRKSTKLHNPLTKCQSSQMRASCSDARVVTALVV